jgi:RNA polymerase-binding transcription factor DksA
VDEREAAARLTADRAATEQRIASMTIELAAVAAASDGSNLDDEHDPEGSTVAFEREQLAAMRSQALDHLADLDAAISRLERGQYGVCETCGEPIADERLTALPATRTCITCAGRRR